MLDNSADPSNRTGGLVHIAHAGFITVVFSSACATIDQYDNQCNFYDDNGNMLDSCVMSSTWDTRTTCEANGCVPSLPRAAPVGICPPDHAGHPHWRPVTRMVLLLNQIVRSCVWGTQHQSDFCSHVGLLAVASVARFILILICLICACMGACCYTPAPAQAAAPNIIIQTGAPAQPAMVVAAQPVASVATAIPQPQPVIVVCPQGCMAGSMIEVNINGQKMSVAVPQGVGPGQQFMVNAPTQP